MTVELTHYTRDVETVAKILTNGFAWMPNQRQLIADLVPSHDFSVREPQEFGMVSFTELAPECALKHRVLFGSYGIVVSSEWAQRHGAQRVLYIDRSGSVFEALSWLFQNAHEQLTARIRHPADTALQMAYTNKAMAGVVGGVMWANLLQMYEYLEPVENSYQAEWRIAHPYPLYGYGSTRDEVIKNVSPPEGWAKHVNVISVEPQDIERFICPAGAEAELRASLPNIYRDKSISVY